MSDAQSPQADRRPVLVVTGAGGFLGRAIVRHAPGILSNHRVVAVDSPSRGGIDLSSPDAYRRLFEAIPLANAADSVLIHAAAHVSFADASEALIDNAAMALSVARWARDVGVGFSVMVGSVAAMAWLPPGDSRQPKTLYGAGKLAAEHGWSTLLPTDRTAIVRMAGVWGWQQRPTLFWNRLLLAAVNRAAPASPVVIKRQRSLRNYIASGEAATCLLQTVKQRWSGQHLLAGRDTVATHEFVDAVSALPGARLDVRWEDDGGTDEVVYHADPRFAPYQRPFSEALSHLWQHQPEWAHHTP